MPPPPRSAALPGLESESSLCEAWTRVWWAVRVEPVSVLLPSPQPNAGPTSRPDTWLSQGCTVVPGVGADQTGACCCWEPQGTAPAGKCPEYTLSDPVLPTFAVSPQPPCLPSTGCQEFEGSTKKGVHKGGGVLVQKERVLLPFLCGQEAAFVMSVPTATQPSPQSGMHLVHLRPLGAHIRGWHRKRAQRRMTTTGSL